jgi:uncharacterized protein (TIGR00725 family)
MPGNQRKIIAVIGGYNCTPEELQIAESVGKEIARQNAILICGGLSGVMEAACKGAREEGGLTIGVLPGDTRQSANPFVQIPIVTGIGYARNVVIVKSAHAVVAIGGSYGTLSEISFALRENIPVIGLNTWSFSRNNQIDTSVIQAQSPIDAVNLAISLAES